ncbi:MAG: hypothetical protein C0459_06815 [Chitinophaga sp.]|jgi:hypothetical protein|nr:hypothetical protein [Chitinophaga sp.]
MKRGNRDLLVLTKNSELNEVEFEQEVECLNLLLYHTESFENFCIVNEIIDVNKLKITQDIYRFQKLVFQKEMKPFVFISNKN